MRYLIKICYTYGDHSSIKILCSSIYDILSEHGVEHGVKYVLSRRCHKQSYSCQMFFIILSLLLLSCLNNTEQKYSLFWLLHRNLEEPFIVFPVFNNLTPIFTKQCNSTTVIWKNGKQNSILIFNLIFFSKKFQNSLFDLISLVVASITLSFIT